MPTIVLHQWEMSPFCNKVRRCLRLKGLDFRVENYNGLKARQAAKLTAQGMLPVLDYENQRIGDSAAIAEFLERHHPDPPLYPKDPEASARARFWESWAGEVLYFFEIQFRMLDPDAREKALDIICEGRPAHERAILGFVFKTRYPGKLKSQGLGRLSQAEIERKFFGHLDDLAALLDRHEWLVGDAPSIADISVASQLDEVVRTSRHAERIRAYPKIRAWMDALDAKAGGAHAPAPAA